MSRCISTHLESSSTRICIWDKRVSLTEKLPLLYCTRIASFYSRYAYTCHYKGMPRPTFFRLPRIKRHKRPCAYYSNTNALFHVPLTGDLVFKLNPGPVRSLDNGSCSIVSRQWQSDTTTALPNIGNPIAAIVSQCAYQELRANSDTRNLIEIRPSRMNMRLHQQMLLCNLNARSVRNKTAQILDFIVDRKVDLVVITEHWLTANDSDVRVELCPNGYCIVDHPRLDHRGGGTGLIYRDSFDVSKVNAGASEHDSFEFSEWIVRSSPHNIRLVIVYRPPYSEEHRVPVNVFLAEFPEYLESLLLCKEQLLITGDFNIHADDPQDSDARKFLEPLVGLGLEQHVDKPTHRDRHILDLTITRMSECLDSHTPVVDQFISDHAAVLCWLTPPRPALSVKTSSYRKIKSINMEQLKRDLQSTKLCLQ